MLKAPWEIENIPVDIDNDSGLFGKFIVYNDSSLILSLSFKISKDDNFINAINNSAIYTGIMISQKIDSILIYLLY